MSNLTTTIVEVLQADATLTVLLEGGIYDHDLTRPLVNDPGNPAETPAAFDPNTVRVRPSAVVVGEVARQLGRAGGWYRPLVVWLYQDHAAPQYTAIEPAAWRIKELLDRRQLVADHEGSVLLEFTGMLGRGAPY